LGSAAKATTPAARHSTAVRIAFVAFTLFLLFETPEWPRGDERGARGFLGDEHHMALSGVAVSGLY
jgi:hypothetical protein